MHVISPILHHEADPEIREFDVIIFIDQDILWLNISVNNLCILMAVLDSSDELAEIFPALLLGKDRCIFSFGNYPLLKSSILNKLCDEIQFIMGGVINRFIEPHYNWVVKLLKNRDLALISRIFYIAKVIP